MVKIFFFGLLSCFVLSSGKGQTNNYLPVTARINNGLIEGNFDTKNRLQLYLGVPYAKPPVGLRRWKAPQKLENWKGVLSTKHFKPRPVQNAVFGDMKSRSDGLSEDCLYLNIWTPANYETSRLPVLVYFNGGGNVAGDGSEPRYDGESMAMKGIVVVTVNYRLNIFGFFAHPELSAEAPYRASGNYGLLDQQAGLAWVKNNITAFGGDPKRITIAGESAGSADVSYQMASPLSKDLIAGAIGESGAGIHPTLAPVSLEEAEKTGLEFAKKAGYPSISALRKLSTKALYELYTDSKRFGFPVVIDGYFLKATLPEVFMAKKQAMVPLLVGWNSAEIPGFQFLQGTGKKADNYIQQVKNVYPSNYETVFRLYPAGDDSVAELSATALASDRFIVYSTWKWFDLQRKNSTQPVYRYLFSRIRPENNPHSIGAAHASEIEYCMGNLHREKDYKWEATDYAVSDTMLNFFANFIISGNPNNNLVPNWPAANAADNNPDIMIIDQGSHATKATNDDRYLFLDKIYSRNKQ